MKVFDQSLKISKSFDIEMGNYFYLRFEKHVKYCLFTFEKHIFILSICENQRNLVFS